MDILNYLLNKRKLIWSTFKKSLFEKINRFKLL